MRSIQHTIGNRLLKGPELGSADKYTTFFASVSLADQAGFPPNFYVQSESLLNSHWFATFIEAKEVESNPTLYYFRTKKVASYVKIRKWKTSFKIEYVNKCQ